MSRGRLAKGREAKGREKEDEGRQRTDSVRKRNATSYLRITVEDWCQRVQSVAESLQETREVHITAAGLTKKQLGSLGAGFEADIAISTQKRLVSPLLGDPSSTPVNTTKLRQRRLCFLREPCLRPPHSEVKLTEASQG